MKITVIVNGTDHTRVVEPRLLLIHFLRDELGLTGSHWGCDTSNCGACVVWLDETPVKSCTVLAVMADGRRVTTVEGLAAGKALDPVQEAFAACHGLQCGFCTPGMMMTARWLLDHNPDPTQEEVREAISGQVCRCTGYENIVRSVLRAAKLEGEEPDEQRLRAAPPQGGRSVHQGAGHVRRRHHAARHAARRDPAQPAGAREDRLGRRQCRARPPDGRRRADRRRPR
jgi:carbon-monoxide dehydrogenase small subunit